MTSSDYFHTNAFLKPCCVNRNSRDNWLSVTPYILRKQLCPADTRSSFSLRVFMCGFGYLQRRDRIELCIIWRFFSHGALHMVLKLMTNNDELLHVLDFMSWRLSSVMYVTIFTMYLVFVQSFTWQQHANFWKEVSKFLWYHYCRCVNYENKFCENDDVMRTRITCLG